PRKILQLVLLAYSTFSWSQKTTSIVRKYDEIPRLFDVFRSFDVEPRSYRGRLSGKNHDERATRKRRPAQRRCRLILVVFRSHSGSSRKRKRQNGRPPGGGLEPVTE
ncbi:Acetolactate synthase small subunit, partial [Frankliniella fusca]